MALGSMIFTLWYMPFETKEANLFEIFNDCTQLVLIYGLFCFTDFVKEPETREEVGSAYIGVSLGNMTIHLLFMFGHALIGIK